MKFVPKGKGLTEAQEKAIHAKDQLGLRGQIAKKGLVKKTAA